jgi:hypothetical protein
MNKSFSFSGAWSNEEVVFSKVDVPTQIKKGRWESGNNVKTFDSNAIAGLLQHREQKIFHG